jgi:hypothetical protein
MVRLKYGFHRLNVGFQRISYLHFRLFTTQQRATRSFPVEERLIQIHQSAITPDKSMLLSMVRESSHPLGSTALYLNKFSKQKQLEDYELLIYLYLRHGCYEYALALLHSMLQKASALSALALAGENHLNPTDDASSIQSPQNGSIIGGGCSHYTYLSTAASATDKSNTAVQLAGKATANLPPELPRDHSIDSSPFHILAERLLLRAQQVNSPIFDSTALANQAMLPTQSEDHIEEKKQKLKTKQMMCSSHPSERVILLVIRHLFNMKLRRKAIDLLASIYVTPPNVTFRKILPNVLSPKAGKDYEKRYIDSKSFQVILHGLAESGFLQLATRLLLTWPEPSKSHYTTVITGFLDRNPPDLRRALELLRQMKYLNITPSLPLITTLFDAVYRNATWRYRDKATGKGVFNKDDAVKILDMLSPMGK